MSNHPVTHNMNDWMRSMEKRVQSVERRGQITNAAQLLGPGLAPYAVQIKDWSGAETTYNGMFYSAPGAFNSPGTDSWWAGLTIAQPGGFGMQVAWDYRGTVTPVAVYSRRWSSVGDTRVFSTWLLNAGSGGSGEPLASALQALSDSTFTNNLSSAYLPQSETGVWMGAKRYSSLEAAVSAAITAGSGSIFFLGDITPSVFIDIPATSNIEIRGGGWGRSILRAPTGASRIMRIGSKTSGAAVSGITLSNFRMVGRSGVTRGLDLIGVQNSDFHNLRVDTVTDTGAIGAVLDTQSVSAYPASIHNSWSGGYITGCYHGLKITKDAADPGSDGCNHNEFTGLTISNFSGIGCDMDWGENNGFYRLDSSTGNDFTTGLRINDDVNGFYQLRTDNSFAGNSAVGIHITTTGQDAVIINPTGNGPATPILEDDDNTHAIILRHPFTRIKGKLEIDAVTMDNQSSVPATPTAGGVLYVQSGALKYKGSSGTITTIAPA